VARPDAQHTCWSLPDIQGNEPDFVLFSEHVGLIIFEVKDFVFSQIEEAAPDHFLIRINGKTVSRKNPFKQARDYLMMLKVRIQKGGLLVLRDPAYHGNPKVPLSCGVVFPNINKHEYTEKGFDKVIGTEKAFFWDGLRPMPDICSSTSG
jgi:hypothetical protein